MAGSTVVISLPKPEKRAPKPRKRIARTQRYPIKRTAKIHPSGASRLGDHRQKVKYANELWRARIYLKEPSHVCPVCRTRRWVDAMHCWAKGPYPALRFDLDNGAPGCRVCHRRLDSDHHAKEQFFRAYIGNDAYERLRLRAMARAKTDVGLEILYLEGRT